MEEDYEAELYGIEDEFEEQFADELEVLAELEEEASQAPSRKVCKFRSRKRTFEEALCAGDLAKEPVVVSCQPCPEKAPQDQISSEETLDNAKANHENPGCLPAFAKAANGLPEPLIEEPDIGQTPKPKRRRRLEAMKKLDFGLEDGKGFKDALEGALSPPLSPRDPRDARTPSSEIPDVMGLNGMFPLRITPPEEGDSKKVLRRPPILEDYINVTSTNGTRVFMVVKEDSMGTELSRSIRQNERRPLHLLGVPFSYLKEQVAEERRKQMLESTKLLTEILNSCLDDEDPSMETVASKDEEELNGESEEDGSTQHSLWVDRFTPRHYLELLSDDYTNRCLLKWLKLWDVVVFGREKPLKKANLSADGHSAFRQFKDQPSKWKTKAQVTEDALDAELDQHNRPKHKVALLCGPPGLGKTTLAHVIVKHAGYNAVEMNASDDRSPEVFKTRIEAATQMKSVLGANEKPNCLIIDEIDGAPTASINVLLGIINRKTGAVELEPSTGRASGSKKRKEGGLLLRPIICICNDQYVPSLRLLRQQAFLLNFPTTSQSRLVQRLHEITIRQGMKADTGALMALCEKTENDIRSCINTLQFLYSRGKKELTVRTVQTAKVGLKDQNKGLFSIWQEIFQLPRMQRQRIGTDPSLPSHFLASGNEDLFGTASGRTVMNAVAQRFHHILHLSTSSGEHEKLRQGLYDNFLNMKVKDSSLGTICLALEWLGFSDLVNQGVLHGQNFQLMRYLPFLPVSFHLLFAASNVPRLVYPNSQQEALAKLTQMQNLVASMTSGIAPNSRSRTGPQSLVLEALCFLLEIISPKLRPVNTQLYSQKEKQQLAQLISTMLAYNLNYHQERTPDGQYIYKLDPNMEEVCRFPDLPIRKPLSYQAKQLIAREIELEKMRRTEATLQARNSNLDPRMNSLQEDGDQKGTPGLSQPKSRVQNHEQRLDQIVKRATFDEKPETDFFGRIIIKKKVSASAADQVPEKNTIEKQIGKAVGQSDIWFRFNEGVSNAVRRNIYIKDLF
ncbi:chromosome transmission fidelity protein 18 homolog isoform X2 [Sceloporus undulatus]|uniref:chromosome transmission fidelity protein 18 homolog isoform X2 n=1 Tax=Sceloporus undulatus TaxID=8520 RepID=UPI001C4DC30B|nr:chromosome transmission fidelity protein 18 homolog isoform X2 [Sceloporus undulatus]